MSPRNSVILAVLILAVLGAYVYWGQDRGGDAASESALAILDVKRDEITKIAIAREDGTVVRFERVGESDAANGATAGAAAGSWRLTEPVVWTADSGYTGMMLQVLSQLKALRTVTGEEAKDKGAAETAPALAAEELAAYGLTEPTVVITVEAESGTKEIRVGDQTPVGESYYATVSGKPAVYTVSAWDIQPFLASVSDYRDRTILSVAATDVRTFKLQTNKASVTLAQEGKEWNLTAPVAHPADPQAVSELLDPLIVLQAQEFIDEPASLRTYGLDKPQAVVAVTAGDPPNQRTEVLYIGREGSEKGTAYVKTAGTTVFLARVDLDSILKSTADSLALKDIVLTNDIFTPQIDLRTESGMALTLLKGENESGSIRWRTGDGKVIPPSLISSFLEAVVNIDSRDLGRAVKDVSAVKLNYATLTLQAPPGEEGKAGWPRVVRFGRPQKNGTVEVTVNTRQRVYTASSEVLDSLLAKAKEIIAAPPFDEEESE